MLHNVVVLSNLVFIRWTFHGGCNPALTFVVSVAMSSTILEMSVSFFGTVRKKSNVNASRNGILMGTFAVEWELSNLPFGVYWTDFISDYTFLETDEIKGAGAFDRMLIKSVRKACAAEAISLTFHHAPIHVTWNPELSWLMKYIDY